MIARIVRKVPVARYVVANEFAQELAADNPRFDAKRFMAACMGSPEPVSSDPATTKEEG
jgi:hypothetical protein